MIQKDADAFYPLAQAYKLPKSTPAEVEYKENVIENALVGATTVPIEIMEKAVRAIEILGSLSKIGNTMLIADAGTGILFCKAALEGSSLSVYVNTAEMKNMQKKEDLNQKANLLVEEGSFLADKVYKKIKFSYK